MSQSIFLQNQAPLWMRRNARTARVSSWDRTGRNADYITLEPGATATLADIEGPGVINHLWFTVNTRDPDYLRHIVLRAAWDGQDHASVECPLGDFFGVGHGVATAFASLPVCMTGGGGKRGGKTAMNSYFAMPFARGARLWIENESEFPVEAFYFYVDYEQWPSAPPASDLLYFHAHWRRENPTDGFDKKGKDLIDDVFQVTNESDAGNYLILDAEGTGNYIGTVMSINNIDTDSANYLGKPHKWWGEGDDMFVIDGETWPPRLHGTGTEDYFCQAWGMQNIAHPFYGTSLFGNPDWTGKWSAYRFHLTDPVIFNTSLRVSVEHGHANELCNDLSSVAYWYQTLPNKPFPVLPAAPARRASEDVAWPE